MLLNIYLPCDNFSNVQTTNKYINCIEYVESMFNSPNCDAFICCGDLNTSFIIIIIYSICIVLYNALL